METTYNSTIDIYPQSMLPMYIIDNLKKALKYIHSFKILNEILNTKLFNCLTTVAYIIVLFDEK